MFLSTWARQLNRLCTLHHVHRCRWSHRSPIFRILFMIIFAYLAILGSLCNELAKKHILLQNRNVRVSETSGWLNLSALMKALWKLKHVPSWKWWLLMATIGILSKASDLATTAVQQKYLHSECDFGIGMVLPMSGPGFISVPPNNGRPVLVAGNAQIISEANSCPQGIYKKVNTDASFCANSGDILGTWKCQSVGEDITYQQGHYTYEDITSDLTRKGLLYPYNSWAIRTDTNDEYLFSHLVAWGSSAFDNSNETFSVKASIELAGLNDDDKVMHSMHCTMHAPGTCCSTPFERPGCSLVCNRSQCHCQRHCQQQHLRSLVVRIPRQYVRWT